jgi:hypothetical protein
LKVLEKVVFFQYILNLCFYRSRKSCSTLSWSSSQLNKTDPILPRFKRESIIFELNQPGWEFYQHPGHPDPVVAVLSMLHEVPQGSHVLEEEAGVVFKEVSVLFLLQN